VRPCPIPFILQFTDMRTLPFTEVEAERLADCGQLEAFIDHLNSLFFEGFAEELRDIDPAAFAERFRSFINQ
jgi:hypothetical protein